MNKGEDRSKNDTQVWDMANVWMVELPREWRDTGKGTGWGEVSNVESEVLAGNLQVEPYRTELWIINAVVLNLYGTLESQATFTSNMQN